MPPQSAYTPIEKRLNMIGTFCRSAVTISTFKVYLGALPCNDNDIRTRTTYLMGLCAPAHLAAREYSLLADPKLVCNCVADVVLPCKIHRENEWCGIVGRRTPIAFLPLFPGRLQRRRAITRTLNALSVIRDTYTNYSFPLAALGRYWSGIDKVEPAWKAREDVAVPGRKD